MSHPSAPPHLTHDPSIHASIHSFIHTFVHRSIHPAIIYVLRLLSLTPVAGMPPIDSGLGRPWAFAANMAGGARAVPGA
eukprot:scaffold59152_cov32-Prasinocladus_malaysianus.AAC.1